MAVNVKMGVDIGGFTSGIKQGQQILKGLNAEMKASEAEFKATGNAEQKAASQTKTLNSQLNVQRGIADQAKQALQAMTDAGINPADAAYQKLYVQMLNAEAGANEALAALNALGGGTAQAAQGADKLSGSLEGISKKMSLEQVREGIGKITDGLEAAAQKAIEFGQRLWDSIMDSARRADDTATMAQMYGIDLQRFKQMQALVAGGMDTTVDAMLTAQDKLKKGIGSGSQEVMDDLQQLGLAFSSGKSETAQLITEDSLELFWEAGKALMAMDDAFDKEATAQRLFGRSWKELVPLFESYGSLDEYNAALDATSVSSEDATKNAAELADRVAALESTWTQLKDEVVGAVAPALSGAMATLEGLLARVLEYLQTPEGKQALNDLSTAVSGLFDDLKKIDPDEVVAGFTSVFNTVVSSVQWLSNNWESVVTAMESILAGWAMLRVTGGVLDVIRIVSGLTTFSSASVAAAGSAAGASWGAAFGSAVMQASPFLAFLYTMLNPAGGAEDNVDMIWDANGNPTSAGLDAGIVQTQEQKDRADEYTRENQKRADRIRRRKEHLIQERNLEAQIEKEQQKAVEIDASRVEEIRKRNERKTTWNPLISAGIWEDQLPDGLQYWLRGMYAPWSQINDKEFNMTDILLPWKGIGKLWYQATGGGDKDKVEVPAELELPTDQAAGLVEQVGPVNIPVTLSFGGFGAGGGGGGMVGALDKWFNMGNHANGLWSVPYDGYLARLHKGERVMTAREVSARNYSSNLYVESMYMNNGTDAAGLAAAMAAAQRRTMSGYGS